MAFTKNECMCANTRTLTKNGFWYADNACSTWDNIMFDTVTTMLVVGPKTFSSAKMNEVIFGNTRTDLCAKHYIVI